MSKKRVFQDRPMSANSYNLGMAIVITGLVVGWIYNPFIGIVIVVAGLAAGLAMNRTGH